MTHDDQYHFSSDDVMNINLTLQCFRSLSVFNYFAIDQQNVRKTSYNHDNIPKKIKSRIQIKALLKEF